ncbi:MAG: nitroreductase family protein [Gemmatimonadota bacterium]|nr:MAG: nitroreductase family protein [Gemmatimonadota bacterium]
METQKETFAEKVTDQKHSRRRFLKLSTGVGTGMALGCMGFAVRGQQDQHPGNDFTFFDIVNNRRSVRKFKSTPVPEDHVTIILDAARLAPTAGNRQPWKFLVVRDREKLNQLKEKCIKKREEILKERGEEVPPERAASLKQHFEDYLSAPVYILVLTDNTAQYPQYNDKDGSLAAGYLILAARALGYGTVFCTDSIPEELCKEVFGIPDNYTRTCIVPVGVPYEWPESPQKKTLEELVVYEGF